MSRNKHVVAWVDHRVAKVFEFNRESQKRHAIRSTKADARIHHKAGCVSSGHSYEDAAYLHEIATALADAAEILIVGPGHVKWQLRAYLNLYEPEIAKRVMAIANADHPTDKQVVAEARKYFSRVDRMTPQLSAFGR
jgi:stalled ribosome rescue protein Dom34